MVTNVIRRWYRYFCEELPGRMDRFSGKWQRPIATCHLLLAFCCLLQQQQPQAGSPYHSFGTALGTQFGHNGIDVEFDGMVTDV